MQILSESPRIESGDPVAGASTLLYADRLWFAWRGRAALRDVSLRLEPGAVLALRGSNGSGKTTLLRLLAGALKPDAGVVGSRSSDPVRGGPAARSGLGLVGTGERGLYARLDVRANIELAVALALAPRTRQRRLIAMALERFALGAIARQRVDRLSTGQRQRVRLALGFASDPGVVLLDEPTASLDATGVELLAVALEELAARGGGALWTVAGAPGAPAALPASRAYVLSDGRLRVG